MTQVLKKLNASNKPIVGLVRGGAIGIGFTTTAHFDFIYCSPDAFFMVPFMSSFQSPEGASTLLFPRQMGMRKANELILLDKRMTAAEAVQCGYANGIIDGLEPVDWPDITKIPTITKLLATDYKTLVNAKTLLNKAKDNDKIVEVIHSEAKALADTWLDPGFNAKLAAYMKGLKTKKRQPKL